MPVASVEKDDYAAIFVFEVSSYFLDFFGEEEALRGGNDEAIGVCRNFVVEVKINGMSVYGMFFKKLINF